MRGYHEISEMTPGNRLMETCEAEGRDPLLALRALKNEYMATEERRLSELVFAHDRIRDLEEELGRSLHHVQALKEHLWELQNQDRLIERQNQLIRDLNRTNEQQVHIIEQQARQITTLQERMTNPPHARRQIRDRRSGRSRRS
ncbi:MAG: hypothetical protein L6R40_001031 [Gallowayella cf. fulva]|nr:MAG: hypothetical protein L6R40_001031 [Xanthomendoza cf. fulva]